MTQVVIGDAPLTIDDVVAVGRGGAEVSLGAAAHLIHGSSEGRFRITYCPGHLTRQEVEGVNFQFQALIFGDAFAGILGTSRPRFNANGEEDFIRTIRYGQDPPDARVSARQNTVLPFDNLAPMLERIALRPLHGLVGDEALLGDQQGESRLDHAGVLG